MTTVKEVELTENGEMVTPIVLADSVKNLDGTKYKNHRHDDSYYTKNEIDNKLSSKRDFNKGTLLLSDVDRENGTWTLNDSIDNYSTIYIKCRGTDGSNDYYTQAIPRNAIYYGTRILLPHATGFKAISFDSATSVSSAEGSYSYLRGIWGN